jgi:protein TonB
MGVEPRPVSGEELGSLQSCLVGGDPEQLARERRVRRKSLILSTAMQVLVVAAIVLLPLFGKPALMASDVVVPIPPYYSRGERHAAEHPKPHPPGPERNVCRICAPTNIPPTIITHTSETDDEPAPAGFLDPPTGTRGEIPLVDTRAHPETPHEVSRLETPKIVHVTHIDPAMLKVRIDPIYPILMRQTGRSGQVQLHAIIGTDGTIQSLQAVGGDLGFYQSAMEAVRQWRYKPTILNGNPVAVDTFITVIYNIGR